VKLSTLAMFGAGYVLGTRAGRGRYDQLRVLARRVADEFDEVGVRERLENVSSRLEAYARENRVDSAGNGRRAQTRS
jgi:hypothetical protein